MGRDALDDIKSNSLFPGQIGGWVPKVWKYILEGIRYLAIFHRTTYLLLNQKFLGN